MVIEKTEKQDESPPVRSSEASVSIAPSSTPIVGRQREIAALMNLYQAAKDEHTRVVLLAGEPGIGKTRLLDEVALSVARDGAVVLRGSASEAEGMPPFLPFLEAFGWYIQTTSEEKLRAQISNVPRTLVNLLPELATYMQDLFCSPPVPPEQARLRLYEAAGIFLEAISSPRMPVLIFDDLHWADTASLDMLRYLTHYRSPPRLFILGAYRESDIDRIPALARTLVELSRQRVLTTIRVEPLSLEEIGRLAIDRHGKALGAEVDALLYTQSEGNPFFAEELLDGWIESGVLKQGHQQWIATATLAQNLPPTISGALRQRFARLPPAVTDQLRVAAIIGRTFDLALLATVQGQEAETVEEYLLEATRARLIYPDQQGRYTFSHAKIREFLYVEVSTSRRRHLHELIGGVLEAQSAHEQIRTAYQLADLAFHFVRSGDRERGVQYTLLAATRALQTAAAEEAMAHYRTALELLDHDDRRRGSVLLDLGATALLAGEDQEAELIYRAAQDWLLQNAQEDKALHVARALHGSGLALRRQEKRQEAQTTLGLALTYLEDDQCVERVKILLALSQLLMIYLGKQKKGLAYARQALEMARKLGETELGMIAQRIILGNLSIRGSDLSSAMQALEQALAHTEKHGTSAEAGECCLNLAMTTYWLAEIRRSQEVSLHRIALIERCRDLYQLRTAYSWPVLLLASQGRWTEAEQAVARARPVIEHLTSPMPQAFLRQFQGFLAYQQENYPHAEYELTAAHALVSQNSLIGLGEIMFYFGLLGLVQARLGKYDEAIASAAWLEHTLELLPDGLLPTAPMRICLALIAIALGDYDRAKGHYLHLQAFQGQYYWFLVDRVLGLLATLSNEWEAAAAHLAAAEATARREGLLPELGRTLLGQAELTLARGGHQSVSHAAELLSKALEVFEVLEMKDSTDRTRQRLRFLSHGSHDSTQLPLPANLTQREVAVLRLVSHGKSNGQIARELVISEKTVANHLTHIFNKTNSENRTAATVFAIHHSLT